MRRSLRLIVACSTVAAAACTAAAGRVDRETLLANPLLAGRTILFVVRQQYRPDHHNTATMFQTGEINTDSFTGGSALKTIELSTGRVKTLLELPEGVVRDPDISFDGQKILVSIRRNRNDDYHIYELNSDGSGLRQLTTGSGVSDIDPIYLPDDRILFTSTREPKYCMCNRHIMGNLFTMNADGAQIQQIGHSTLHEGHASLLPDGRVIYDRWEYVDRNFGDAQGVWVCNPDGTNHAVYWGNNTNSPGAVLDARAIPGTPLFIATFSSCHDRPWGALAIVDRRLGIDLRPSVVRTWPAQAINLVGIGNYDTFGQVRPKYEDPFPLSDKYVLCSRMTGQGEQMGIYLVDVSGDDVLLHVEGPGCFDPMPLGPRPRPPVIPSRVDLTKSKGYFYVSNVYEGTGMKKIPQGTVKRLRVVESPEKRFWTDLAFGSPVGGAPGMAWKDFNNKRILGSVPVEPDGSAYFAVPADTFVYFQLLDENGMMVQSMRSGTIVRPGERTGCVGCHECRRQTISTDSRMMATRRPPSELELDSWLEPPRNFGYLDKVQPVFDRKCVSCHDYGKEAGKKLNLAGDLNLLFNTSYVELRAKNYVQVIDAGPSTVQMPKSWGSHASRLVPVLLNGHGNPEIDRQANLTQEDIDRIITWIDINAPYYAEYAGGAYGGNVFGRCPLDDRMLARLQELTGAPNLAGEMTAINFTRPALSPCLSGLAGRNDPRYLEALKIIQSGKDTLARDPRPDMPNFRLSDPTEAAQQRKYDALRKAEAGARAAIIRQKKGAL